MVADTFNMTVGKPLAATVASTTGTWLSATNLLSPQPGEKATCSASGYVILDLGVNTLIRQVALMYTDFLTGETTRIRASTNADGITGAVLDSLVTVLDAQALLRPAGFRHFFYQVDTPVTARYIRIEFGVNGRSAGLFVAANPLQLEYNVDYGDTSWGYDEADDGEELDSGVEVLVERTPRPVLNFTASWVTQEEMDAGWEELGRLQHEGTPVLIARRPDPHTGRHNGLYYGILRMVPVVAAEFDMFEVQGRIRSMI